MRAIALCLGILVGSCAVGCGASPLRQHAIASRMTMATLDGAGVAIEESARLAIERCDGSRSCIEGVGEQATRAAAARDALIAPANAYRAAVLASGGEETPGLVEYLGVVARPLAAGWPAMADALRALGVPVPQVTIPTTTEVQ